LGAPVDYIARTRARYDALGYPPYRWVENQGPPPWTPVRKTLAESRLALIGSGGVYRVGQKAFHFRDDASFRVIDSATPKHELRISHFAYDLRDARADPDVVFPLDTLRRLVAEGRLGSLCRRSFGFMGGIYSARKVRDQLAPALVERVLDQRADIALLVPV
jgi:D-proline reductase (dithiol) PrdB